jgi:hypothetical protein
MKMILASVAAVLVTSTAAFAQLTGTQVTGSLEFDGVPINYFDPANGFVPAGYANTSSPTITIAAGDNVFGFQDSYNTDTADFNGNSLTVNDVMNGNGALPWVMTFTDTAFTGITTVSDDYINGGIDASLAGDVITLAWNGSYGPDEYVLQGSYSATFDVNSSVGVPDGASSVGLLGLALAGLGSMKRFKAFAR